MSLHEGLGLRQHLCKWVSIHVYRSVCSHIYANVGGNIGVWMFRSMCESVHGCILLSENVQIYWACDWISICNIVVGCTCICGCGGLWLLVCLGCVGI